MARPPGKKLPDLKAAHDAIVEASIELKDSMLANPPRTDIEASRYVQVLKQFEIWDDTFEVLRKELRLFANPTTREQSIITNVKEVMMLNATCREAISLYSNIVQRRKELEAGLSRDDLLRRIADRVDD